MIINRFVRSIRDFTYVNDFKKESVAKAIKFLLLGYLAFALLLTAISAAKFLPAFIDFNEKFDVLYNDLPAFEVTNGEFKFDDASLYEHIEYLDLRVIFDLETDNPYKYFIENDVDEIVITGDSVYFDAYSTPIKFGDYGMDFNKNILLTIKSFIIPGISVFILLFSLVGLITVFLASLLIWGITITINTFKKKTISTSDCYKIAIYSMVLPGILTLIKWNIGFYIPYGFYIYVGLAAYYSNMFINNYKVEENSIEDFYL